MVFVLGVYCNLCISLFHYKWVWALASNASGPFSVKVDLLWLGFSFMVQKIFIQMLYFKGVLLDLNSYYRFFVNKYDYGVLLHLLTVLLVLLW